MYYNDRSADLPVISAKATPIAMGIDYLPIITKKYTFS